MQRNTMQRCFLIPELLIHVFEYLSVRDTYSAAQVCRLWGDLAVPTLWRVHPVQFKDLIRVLPLQRRRGAASKGPRNFIQYTTHYEQVQDSVTLSQWKRFICLSRHVKILQAKSHWSDSSLMLALSNLLQKHGGSILPNLRVVAMDAISVQKYALPAGFFSPNIRSFTVKPTEDVTLYHDQLLKVLLAASPNLQELALHDRHTIMTTFSSFQSFSYLTSLECSGTMSWEALASISCCDTVRRLSIINLAIVLDRAKSRALGAKLIPLSRVPSKSMPSVQELEIGSGEDDSDNDEDLEHDATIHNKISFPSLRSVVVDSDWHQREWLEKISTESPEVTEILLKLRGSVEPLVLQSLRAFGNLRQLTLEHCRLLNFDAMLTQSLDKWLPTFQQLEVFKWTFSHHTEPHGPFSQISYLTIGVLSKITSECPNLRLLSLPINSNNIPLHLSITRDALPIPEASPCTSLRMIQLTICGLRRAYLSLVAETLVELFPGSIELEVSVRSGTKVTNVDMEDELAKRITAFRS